MNQKSVQDIPINAYLDEFGGYGFEFDKEGVFSKFIVSAVIIKRENLHQFQNAATCISTKLFQGKELKSSHLGNDEKRWVQVVAEIAKLDITIVALIFDKKKMTGIGLQTNKQSFFNHLHGKIDTELFTRYKNIAMHSDQYGTNDFMEAYRDFIYRKHPQTLFDYTSGTYCFADSKNSIGIQVADIVSGCFARIFEPKKKLSISQSLLDMLKSKVAFIKHWPEDYTPYSCSGIGSEEKEYDKKVSMHCYHLAARYVVTHRYDEDDAVRLKVRFLDQLIFHFDYSDRDRYLQTSEIAAYINKFSAQKKDSRYITRNIVGGLRQDGMIIASANAGGYKIPTKLEDIYDYLNHCNSILVPMLSKIFTCHNIVKQLTLNNVNLLDKDQYKQMRICYENILQDRI